MEGNPVSGLGLRNPTVTLPERVELKRQLGGIGGRVLAYLLDLLIRILFTLALYALVSVGVASGPLTMGMSSRIGGMLLFLGLFLINWAYFVVFEMTWGGQTPGKRTLGLRVERLDGLKPRFWQSAVRNLLRMVDWLPWGYGLGLSAALLSRKGQRLGDTVAGTIVVSVKKPLQGADRHFALDDLPDEQTAERAGLSYAHWELLQDYRNWVLTRGKPEEGVAREVVRTLWSGLSPETRQELKDLKGMHPPRALEILHGHLSREGTGGQAGP